MRWRNPETDLSDGDNDIDVTSEDDRPQVQEQLMNVSVLPRVESGTPEDDPPELDQEWYASKEFTTQCKARKKAFLRNVSATLLKWTAHHQWVQNGKKVCPAHIASPGSEPIDSDNINWRVLKRYFREKRSLKTRHRRLFRLCHLVSACRYPYSSSRELCRRLLFQVRATFWTYMGPVERAFAVKHHRGMRASAYSSYPLIYVFMSYY